ncbi:MAG: hypothetical protein V3V16_06140 [Melioribacteraceae bacterium]
MKKKILVSISSFVFLLTLILQLGCNTDSTKTQNIKSAVVETLQKETQIDSFSISLSSAGGITGLGSGYTLTSDGVIKYWRQLSFVKDTTLWEEESDITKILQFKNELDSCGILQKKYDGTDNMTTSLVYNLSDTSYTWTWEDRGIDSNIPTEITSWYKEVIEFCTSIKK